MQFWSKLWSIPNSSFYSCQSMEYCLSVRIKMKLESLCIDKNETSCLQKTLGSITSFVDCVAINNHTMKHNIRTSNMIVVSSFLPKTNSPFFILIWKVVDNDTYFSEFKFNRTTKIILSKIITIDLFNIIILFVWIHRKSCQVQ